MEPLVFADSDGSDNKKERRFSVHDVNDDDNNVPFGQPDNQAMSGGDYENNIRITSTSDDNINIESDRDRNRSSIHSDSHKSEEDDNVYIHENVVDNEYTNDDMINEANPDPYTEDLTDDQQQRDSNGSGSNARDSKENTPEKQQEQESISTDKQQQQQQQQSKQNEEEYPSHYRHPSLAAGEDPVSDDESGDKDHGRYLSTLIHENVDSDYEMTPSEEQVQSEALFTKNISRLRDYWCHSSSAIAIEDDTDANISRDKEQQSNGIGGGGGGDHNQHGSVHEMNNYTRPFMSKFESNNKWDSVFGNGIISDTHNKYISNKNGNFIEWIIEINNMSNSNSHNKTKSMLMKMKNQPQEPTIIVGISSDLLGETNNDSFTKNKQTGFGFDNLGNIRNGNIISNNNNLRFESRDVVHIILDYSNQNIWKFYAKVGDIDEKDYENLSESNEIQIVFDKINPGSYRLAVSLFSSNDALIIESCKIHGNDNAEFYQELKNYSIDNDIDAEQQEQDVNNLTKEEKEDDEDEEDEEEEEEVNDNDDNETKVTDDTPSTQINVNTPKSTGNAVNNELNTNKQQQQQQQQPSTTTITNVTPDQTQSSSSSSLQQETSSATTIAATETIQQTRQEKQPEETKKTKPDGTQQKKVEATQEIVSTHMEVSPSPNSFLTPPPPHSGNNKQLLSESEEREASEDSIIKPLHSQRSILVHDDSRGDLVPDSQINDTGTRDINYDNVNEEDDQKQIEETPKGDNNDSKNTKSSNNDKLKIEEQSQIIADLKKKIEIITKENKDKDLEIIQAEKREKLSSEKINKLKDELTEYKEKAQQFESSYLESQEQLNIPRKNSTDTNKINNLTKENERLSHELKLAQDRVKSLDSTKKTMQEKLNNAIESKMQLIISTSEEIDHYRKLIQDIAQNKLGCQLLSDFANNDNQHRNGLNNNNNNGYY